MGKMQEPKASAATKAKRKKTPAFERFEMWVWFVEPVPKGKRAAIEKLAPEIGELEWPQDYLLWVAAGDIQSQLVETYGTAKAKKRMRDYRKKLEEDEDADPWGGDSDEMLAMGSEQKEFNTALEVWLTEIHDAQPILFAARREDLEAGGTKLSAWHKRSLATLADVEAHTKAILAKKPLTKDDGRENALTILEWFANKK